MMNGSGLSAVHCAGVTKAYGLGETRVQALRGIDLDVLPGELLMLVSLYKAVGGGWDLPTQDSKTGTPLQSP
jgi:hypothetical protein